MAACAPLLAVAASPAPSPSPAPADPCGGPARLLATANRPTVGYSTCAVKKDTLVVELGYQNQQNGTPIDGSVQTQVPQNFSRVGVAKNFELDIIGPNYFATRAYGPSAATNGTSHGVTDSGLGFKYELPLQGRWTFAVDGLDLPPNGSPRIDRRTHHLHCQSRRVIFPESGDGGGYHHRNRFDRCAGNDRLRAVRRDDPIVRRDRPNPELLSVLRRVRLRFKDRLSQRRARLHRFRHSKTARHAHRIDVEYGHAFTGIPALKFDYIGTGLVLQFW